MKNFLLNTTTNKTFERLLPIIIDLETGGVDVNNSPILEIAIIIINKDIYGKMFPYQLINFNITPYKNSRIQTESILCNKINIKNILRFSIKEKDAIKIMINIITKILIKTNSKGSIFVVNNVCFD